MVNCVFLKLSLHLPSSRRLNPVCLLVSIPSKTFISEKNLNSGTTYGLTSPLPQSGESLFHMLFCAQSWSAD